MFLRAAINPVNQNDSYGLPIMQSLYERVPLWLAHDERDLNLQGIRNRNYSVIDDEGSANKDIDGQLTSLYSVRWPLIQTSTRAWILSLLRKRSRFLKARTQVL